MALAIIQVQQCVGHEEMVQFGGVEWVGCDVWGAGALVEVVSD